MTTGMACKKCGKEISGRTDRELVNNIITGICGKCRLDLNLKEGRTKNRRQMKNNKILIASLLILVIVLIVSIT